MEQKNSNMTHLGRVNAMLTEGRDMVYIESRLQKEGLDESVISEVFKEVKRIKNAKRTQTGNMLLVIGAILMILGFATCIFQHYNEGSMSFALYGLTMVGLSILFAGLVMIFQ